MNDAAARDDQMVVDALVRRSGTSFYWAIRMLPEEKRRAMFAVYAFCREVDDIADEPGEDRVKSARLQFWREEVARLFAGSAATPISRALLVPVQHHGLRKEDFEAVIAGMEMDAGARLRIADCAELDLYCDRVACAVGRLSTRIFGAEPATGDELAAALGRALQLTNILRDLEEDARRDRLYLPGDMLAEEGIHDTDDLDAVFSHAGIAPVCDRLAALAGARFEDAAAIIARCDHRQMRPARIMMEVYRRTLRRLRARGWQRWSEPVSVSRLEKLWVAFRYGVI
jgi:presqualene diphosphate synthase